MAEVVAVDGDVAERGVMESGDQFGDGRLAGSGRADHGQNFAGFQFQVDVA